MSTNDRRPLSELNLIDNFLFSSAISHEKFGIPISEVILSTILQREVSVKHITAEKVILPGDTKHHGIRLDALIEENRTDVFPGDFFDLEPDNKQGEKKLLPKRARYYHSRIDGKRLESGQTYDKLPDIWVIFILSFDPFGEDRIVYTIRNQCVELPEMEYNDGATTKFLYINGEKGDASEGVRELLHFIGNSTAEFAVNPELRRIHSYVEEVKKDPAVKEDYMLFMELLERERREAAQEEKERADAAEARADAAGARADAAEARADSEKVRADSEKVRADVAEAKIAELMDLLKVKGIPLPE